MIADSRNSSPGIGPGRYMSARKNAPVYRWEQKRRRYARDACQTFFLRMFPSIGLQH